MAKDPESAYIIFSYLYKIAEDTKEGNAIYIATEMSKRGLPFFY